MEESKFWPMFERTRASFEALAIVIVIFGPITGIVLLIMGDLLVKMVGLGVIFFSMLLALYHLGYSMLMRAILFLAKEQHSVFEEITKEKPTEIDDQHEEISVANS